MNLCLRDLAFLGATAFNTAACAAHITGGGGTTFDCYEIGDYTEIPLPKAGTGIGQFLTSNNPFTYPFGDPFDVYAVGTPGATDLNDGVNIGTWMFGDNQFANLNGDNFDTYTVGTPGATDLNDGVNIGTWMFGDGP